MENKRKEVKIRISEAVYKALKTQSEALGLSMSAYITHLLLVEAKKTEND